jgi:nitrogen fixation protein NifU and related proteins
MSLNKLYQDMILEHNKNPRNFKTLSDHTHYSHGHNPLCGDDYIVMIKLEEDVIEDITFVGEGCAISKASGSLMTQILRGKTINEVMKIKDQFIDLVTKDESEKDLLGKLIVFEGVKQYPIRVKCAALVWRALEDALGNNNSKHLVSTE